LSIPEKWGRFQTTFLQADFGGKDVKDRTHKEGEALLRLEDIFLSFGGVTALDDVSMAFGKEGIFAIIGPNGAGKTCIFNVINGFYRPQKGKVYFDGQNITRLSSA